MAPSTIQTAFKSILAELNIHKRRLSVHSLRHSYATHLIELGVPTEHVKQFMGHKNLATTEQYVHFTREGIRESFGKIERLAEPYHEL